MVINFSEIYYGVGNVETATLSADKKFIDVAGYGFPKEVYDLVERTVFNKEKKKKYGTGYSDVDEITFKFDLDADNVAQINEIAEMAKNGESITIGYVVDEDLPDLNLKCSGVITNVARIDGDVAPGSNAQSSFGFKCDTDFYKFEVPTSSSTEE